MESHLIGGECSFYACMPSKALLRPGELLAEVRRIPGVREAVSGLDVEAALARRDQVIHDLDDSGMEPWLESKGIALVRGHGRLDGERRVRVDDDVLVARRAVVVCTGSGAAVPPIDGLREAEPWNNRQATTAKSVPARLAVLGGGVVGVEMAQAWSSLGSQVTLIEAADRLIAREEPFASQDVADGLHERGVDVRLRGLGRRRARIGRRGRGGALDRRSGARRRAAGGGRARAGDRRDRSRDRRPGARQADRGGRLDAGQRLAVRDRRRQRARAAHAHGQVPGASGGRGDPRGRGARDRGRRALPARDPHGSAGGGGRVHARRRRAPRG